MIDPRLDPLGSLYVLLFMRNDPPKANDFHWGPLPPPKPHHRRHKVPHQDRRTRVDPDNGTNAAIMKEFLLVGLFRIADVPAHQHPHLDRTFRSLDARLNHRTQTCRVWALDVLALLRKQVDSGERIFKCVHIQALQQEFFDWGNLHATSAARNEQPRPIRASTLCGLSHRTMGAS